MKASLYQNKGRLIYAIISPALSMVLLLLALSFLLNKIEALRSQSILKLEVPNMITKDVPKLSEDTKNKSISKPQRHITQKPTKKSQPKHNLKKSQVGAPGLLSKAKVPAINIYYSHSNIYEYMQALAIRGCIFLFKSPSGSFFGRYDPSTNNITTNIPRDLKNYSPRSRVLAIYGENPLFKSRDVYSG